MITATLYVRAIFDNLLNWLFSRCCLSGKVDRPEYSDLKCVIMESTITREILELELEPPPPPAL